MIGVAGVKKQRVAGPITGIGATQRDIDVLSAVIIEIGESHAMALLNMAGAGGSRYILKELAFGVAKHPLGDQCAEIGITGTAIKVQPTVIIQITIVMAHGVAEPIKVHRLGYVTESAVTV